MSRFADETEPGPSDDLDAILAKVPEPAEREGLPAGFRMRADAHYVEVLDSPPGPWLRSLDVNAIEAGDSAADAPPAALVESIRAHGLLEPLVVQHRREGRYRLIAGHARLDAARSAGLRQVPCMLHAVSDAKATELAAAASAGLPAATAVLRPGPDRKVNLPTPVAATCTSALDATLRSIGSAAALLSAPSMVTREGAAQLVAVESRRALLLLNVLRVLGEGLAIRRAAVPVLDLLERIRQGMDREYRMAGSESSVRVSAERGLVVYGSEELLRTAISGVMAAFGIAAGHAPSQIEITAIPAAGDSSVAIDIRDPGLSIPALWADRAFDDPWPVADGTTALVLLQAARQVARAHGGSLTIEADEDATVARLTI